MEEPKCKDCKHFRPHYVPWHTGTYAQVPCGHCVYPRLKHRTPDTVACVHFLQKQSDEACAG